MRGLTKGEYAVMVDCEELDCGEDMDRGEMMIARRLVRRGLCAWRSCECYVDFEHLTITGSGHLILRIHELLTRKVCL